jgi:hypothetical protein
MISRAATEIAFKLSPDRCAVEVGFSPDHINGRHHHPGCTEAALQAMIVPKCLLHRVKRAARRHPLNRHHVRLGSLNCEYRARFNGLAIYVNDAGAALTRVAANVRSGETQCVAEEVNQESAILDIGAPFLSVYSHGNNGHPVLPSEDVNLRMLSPAVKNEG